MRLTAAEKAEVIRLVEGSDLSVRRTLTELGCAARPSTRGIGDTPRTAQRATVARRPAAQRYWNRIPPAVRKRIVTAALADPERSPRELAWQLTDRPGHFLSESSVYRILKAAGSDHQSGLHPDPCGRPVRPPDAAAERALADGFHVPAGRGLGLVLPLDRARRLLALHPGVDPHDDDAGERRDDDARSRAGRKPKSIRSGSSIGPGSSATTGRATCRRPSVPT